MPAEMRVAHAGGGGALDVHYAQATAAVRLELVVVA